MVSNLPIRTRAVKISEVEKAKAELEILYAKTVKEIFPEVQQVRTGRRAVEKRVRTTPADKKRFKDHFDEVWNKRVAAGQIPAWDLKEYRTWLSKASDSEGPYPPINAKELLEDYISEGATLTEYFDFKYLEFLEKVKFTRPDGASAGEAVQAYLKTLDPSLLKHFAKSVVRGTKKVAKSWMGGAAASTIFLVSAFPGELVNAALGPWIMPIKDFFTTKAKEVSTQAAESVRDWAVLFKGGEEEYVNALVTLRAASYRFDEEKFDEMPRPAAATKLKEYLAITTEQLPRFHALVMVEQKNFETVWNKRLEDFRESVVTGSSVYTQHRIALDQLKSIISSRSDGATPEELERMAEYTHELDGAENYIANVLADWLFYKQARGNSKPLDPALDRNFATIYEKYMRNMSVGRLATAINMRVKAHVKQLETYSSKVTGKKNNEPASGAPPAAKPEEQIRVETPTDDPSKPKPPASITSP